MRDISDMLEFVKINETIVVNDFQLQYRFKEGSLDTKISKFLDICSQTAHIANPQCVGGAV
jgi:hypothetical protein